MAKQFNLGSQEFVKSLRVVDGLDNKVEYIKQIVGKLTPHSYTSPHRQLRMGRFVSMSGTPRYGETLKLTKVLRPEVKQGFNPLNPLGLSYAAKNVTSDASIKTNANDKNTTGLNKPSKINLHVMTQDQTTVDIFEKRDLVGLLDAKVDGNTLGILDVRMLQHLNAIEDDLIRKLIFQIDGKVPSDLLDPDGNPVEKWWKYDVEDTNKVEVDFKTISNRDFFLLFVDGVTSFLKIRDNFTLKITKNDIVSFGGEEIKKKLILGEKEALDGGSVFGDKVYERLNAGELTKEQIWGVGIITDNVMDEENASTGVETRMTIQLREASMVFEDIMETYFGKVSVANNLDRAFYIRYAFGGENIYPEYIIKYVQKAGAREESDEPVKGLGAIVNKGMETLKKEKLSRAEKKAAKDNEAVNLLAKAIESLSGKKSKVKEPKVEETQENNEE